MYVHICQEIMHANDKKHIFEKISKTKHTYCGILNENGHRINAGCEEWFNEEASQKYSGQFHCNNLHQKGVFINDKKDDQSYFDGLFYANKLEGYGKVISSDNTVFEGLFKQHVRFGPGVLTHEDGCQDVGLWDGFQLRRLVVSVGKNIPRFEKSKLLRYRTLVPLCIEKSDAAKEMLTEHGANETVMGQSDRLYHENIRNPHSVFFNKRTYDERFFSIQECTIDMLLTKAEFQNNLGREIDLETFYQKEEEHDFIQKSLSSCVCFEPSLDRFGHICVQLEEIERRLKRLVLKKERIESDLLYCKNCCDNIIIPNPETRKENLKDTTDDLCEKRESSVVEKSKKTSFYSTTAADYAIQDLNQSRSEIELRTYLYTTDFDLMDEEERPPYIPLPYERSSKMTLPFNQWSGMFGSIFAPAKFSKSVNHDYGLDEMAVEGADNKMEEDTIRIFQKCMCNDIHIQDFDSLTDQLKQVRQEEAFFTVIRNNLKRHLDIEFERFNQAASERFRFVKKVVVTDLLAWNNEPYWISILKHCFRHRLSENNVTFRVSDLLAGLRNSFNIAGDYERGCVKFLEACYEGNDKQAFKYLKMFNINPDLCDCKGNTGLMLATVRNKTPVIALLVNCGAKVDTMNDDCLTPLITSLLKYISFKHLVNDWEIAFLKDVQLEDQDSADIKQWRQVNSDVSSDGSVKRVKSSTQSNAKSISVRIGSDKSETQIKDTSEIDLKSLDTKQEYVFNLDYVRMPQEVKKCKKETKKGKEHRIGKHKEDEKIKIKTKKTEMHKRKGKQKPGDEVKLKNVINEQKMEKMLEKIKHTFSTLLAHGSDSNFGKVPMKPIFLAVFSDDSDIVKDLLVHEAEPNATTDNNLTSLHMIVSLRPTPEKLKMCQILLDHNANPNIKTDSGHWSQLRQEILGTDVENADENAEGKNVLHVLSMREDFLSDEFDIFGSIATVLVDRGCRTDDFYLGHTPLSLATLRANVRLIQALLKTKKVDPHQVLKNGMGNALSVLILDRFKSKLADDNKIKAAKSLMDHGLNPLHRIGNFENIIAFMEHQEYEVKLKKSSKKLQEKQKKNTKDKKLANKSSKKSSTTKTKSNKKKLSNKSSRKSSVELQKVQSKNNMNTVKHYITDESRNVLYRYFQGKAVEYLYHLLTETLVADALLVVLAKFVKPDEALRCVNLLFESGVIIEDRFSPVVVCDLLEFIKLQQIADQDNVLQVDELKEVVKNLSWKHTKRLPKELYLPVPEADRDEKKYMVCFQCMRAEGKSLIVCPSCELVRFCSEECNRKSVVFKSHPCKVLFYDKVQYIFRGESQPKRLPVLLEMADKMRNERLAISKMQELNEKLLKMKFKSKKWVKQAYEAVSNFQKLEKEKREFEKANMAWDYSSIEQKVQKTQLAFAFSENVHRFFNDQSSAYATYYFNVLRSNGSKVSESLLQTARQSFPAHQNLRSRQSNFTANNSSIPGTPVTSPTSAMKSSGRSEVLPIYKKDARKHEDHTKTKNNKKVFLSKSLKAKEISKNTKYKNEAEDDHETEITELLETFGEKMLLYQNIGDDNREYEMHETSKGHGKNKSYYMELLAKIFEDFNLPLLLLPYACYKNGQVYYSMTGKMSYFGSSFHKLQLPD